MSWEIAIRLPTCELRSDGGRVRLLSYNVSVFMFILGERDRR